MVSTLFLNVAKIEEEKHSRLCKNMFKDVYFVVHVGQIFAL